MIVAQKYIVAVAVWTENSNLSALFQWENLFVFEQHDRLLANVRTSVEQQQMDVKLKSNISRADA